MSNGSYAPQRLWKSCQRYSGTKTSRTDINLSVYSILTIGVVQFTFNTNQLAISEGGDLPNEVSILKIGQNEMTISFQVRVIPGTAFDPSGIVIMILIMSKMNLMWTKSMLFKLVLGKVYNNLPCRLHSQQWISLHIHKQHSTTTNQNPVGWRQSW